MSEPLPRTRAAEGLPRRRFTVAEVEAMVAAGIIDEDERVELIGGELVPMSPKGSRHELVKVALNDGWSQPARQVSALRRKPRSGCQSTPILEPDFVIFDRATGLRGQGRERLLVVEIADTSRRYDMGRKAKLYASFGVRELWVIDAVKMTSRVFRSPTAKGYGETRDYSASETHHADRRPRRVCGEALDSIGIGLAGGEAQSPFSGFLRSRGPRVIERSPTSALGRVDLPRRGAILAKVIDLGSRGERPIKGESVSAARRLSSASTGQ